MKNDAIDFRFGPRLTWTCIGLADDEHKTLVRQDGALLYGQLMANPLDNRLARTLAIKLSRLGDPQRSEQHTESPESAIVVTTLHYNHATLTLTAFAHADEQGKRTDVVLYRIELDQDLGPIPVELALDVHLLDAQVAQKTWGEPSHTIGRPGADILGINRVPQTLVVAHPHKLSWPATREYWTQNAQLVLCSSTFSQSTQGALCFPLNHNDTAHLDENWAQQALEQTRAYWANAKPIRSTFELPAGDTRDMVTACARNIMQARVVHDGEPVYHVGPLFYRGLWVVDGHFLLEAARYLGHDQEVDRALDGVIRRIRPDGSIELLPGHTKETGISLATLTRQAELTGNWKGLDARWDVVRRGVHYIQHLREQAHELPDSAPNKGLMPDAFTDGGANGRRPEYSTPLWSLVGLRYARDAARHLNHDEDAATFSDIYESLLADLYRCAKRDMRTLPDGAPYLPIVMPDGSPWMYLHRDNGQPPKPWEAMSPLSGAWALCHAIYPGQVFEADDPLVKALLGVLERFDNAQGIPTQAGWLSWRASWTYFASFAAHVWLFADRADKAVDYLHAFANHAAPTRVWREEQSLLDCPVEQWVGDMPHNWASAEFIRLARHLIVFERSNELRLLEGQARCWPVLDQPWRIERTPTRFGPVSIHVAPQPQGKTNITIERMANGADPEAVTLRLPEGACDVMLNGRPVPLDGGHISLPTSPARVTVSLEVNHA